MITADELATLRRLAKRFPAVVRDVLETAAKPRLGGARYDPKQWDYFEPADGGPFEYVVTVQHDGGMCVRCNGEETWITQAEWISADRVGRWCRRDPRTHPLKGDTVTWLEGPDSRHPGRYTVEVSHAHGGGLVDVFVRGAATYEVFTWTAEQWRQENDGNYTLWTGGDL